MKKFAISFALIPKNGNKFHIDEIREAKSKEALEAAEKEFCESFNYTIDQMIIREVW